jgi:HSP20 family protein
MTLNRWDPLRDLLNFQEKMNRLMDSAVDIHKRRVIWKPVVDFLETAEAYVFRVDLPGVGRDKINIEIQGNRLTINGERPLEAEPRIAAYHSIERETGVFERQFTVPGHIDVDSAEATYVDGVLVLVLPKCEDDRPGNVRVECRG